MQKPKHGWNTLGNYLHIHRKVLAQYQGGHPNPKTYTERKLTESYFTLDVDNVQIISNKGLILKVKIEKDVEINSTGKRPTARTVGYSYHACTQFGVNLIRYCSPHPRHNQFHHKHVYIDGTSSKLLKLVIEDVPHVSEFFDELISNF